MIQAAADSHLAGAIWLMRTHTDIICRPRLLFQHQAYSNQEPLDMGEREVAAVVEAVCGAAEAPAIWGVRLCTSQLDEGQLPLIHLTFILVQRPSG